MASVCSRYPHARFSREAARFYATNSPGSELDQGAPSLMREQRIDGSLYDELLLVLATEC